MLTEHLLTTDDPMWERLLPAQRSIFGSVEYARICQQHSADEARLFAVTSDAGLIAFPYFLRAINDLPFAKTFNRKQFDILSPEYTGPVALTDDLTLMQAYRNRFDRICREQGIVAEFAHLHPWNWQAHCLHSDDIGIDREIVYVDETLSEDDIWNESLTYACRKNLKRAHQENIRIYAATSLDDVREFYRIYVHTLDRNNALGRYYFPFSFFQAFWEQLPDNSRFMLAEYREQIVAATLYLYDDIDIYSYLGGADQAFQHIRPTNAVVYTTINWARQHGKRRLILGGGYRPDDGIFRFKASFSPLRAHFRVYQHVHLPNEYTELCQAWSAYYGGRDCESNYFPVYRSVPPSRREN